VHKSREHEHSREIMKAINRDCPRSGNLVQSDALTTYKAALVVFCNTDCRDDVAENSAEQSDDKHYFDTLPTGK
jgi:hypothetical protein